MREDLLAAKTVALKPSGIRRFFDVVADMPDAISLGVGEPDFDTPWHVRDEGIYSLEKGRTFYTSNSGLKELRKEIAAYIQRTQHIDYHYLHEILVTVGGSEAIDLAMRAMINPGDEVLIPEPAYVSYEPTVLLADGKPVIVHLKEENRFRLTPEELEEAITPKTKILVMPFPNNPTGAIMEQEDLEKLVPIIIEHDLIVVSDEIYGELTYGGKRHVSIASLPGMQERTILINGFSKAYAMTGWRLGYACGPEAIIRQMTKIHQFCIMCAPTTSQYAAVEALRNGDDDIAMMREAYDERRRFVLHELDGMGLPCFEPEGAFYVFPCIKEFGMTSDEFATKLLEQQQVAIVPGTAFGDCGEGYLRISYAYSIDNLREALGRLSTFVTELRDHKMKEN
jgi:aminotransferase